jgi:hypothetical protein
MAINKRREIWSVNTIVCLVKQMTGRIGLVVAKLGSLQLLFVVVVS